MTFRNPLSRVALICGVLAAVIISAVSFTACSNTTDPVVKQTGDPNDSEFLAAQDQLNTMALEFGAVDWLDAVWDSIPGFAPSSVTDNFGDRHNRGQVGDTILTFSLTVDDVSWWMIVNASVTDGVDTATLVDSVRLLQGGVPISPEFADSADAMQLRAHASIVSSGLDGFDGYLASHAAMDISLLGDGGEFGPDTLLINASSVDSLIGSFSDQSGSCDISMVSSKTATNIVDIDAPEYECPIDGEISMVATMDMSCTDGQNTFDVNADWTVLVSYNGDQTADVVYENPTTRWTATIDCISSPSGNIGFPGRN